MSLLTTQEAAEYLGVSRYFLERDRVEGPNIPVVYVGHRSPRYRLQDLDSFVEAQIRHNPESTDEENTEWTDFEDDISFDPGEDSSREES